MSFPPPSLGRLPPLLGFPTLDTFSCQGGCPRCSVGVLQSRARQGVTPPNPASPPLPFASFQVPWFETISIAVSNDISEQSLEEFSREVRELLSGLGRPLGFRWHH